MLERISLLRRCLQFSNPSTDGTLLDDVFQWHADVTVSTPAGQGENLDYFLLAPEDGEWRYLMFLPEVVRADTSQEEIDQAMRRSS